MPNNRFYLITITALLLLLGYLTYQISRPFLAPIAWAIVISIVFYPLYAYILRFVKWKPVASFIVLLIVIMIIIGPFSYTSYLLLDEVRNLSGSIDSGQIDSVKNVLSHPAVRSFLKKYGGMLHITVSEEELQKTIIENISGIGRSLLSMVPGGLGNVMGAAVNFVFMIFAVFFILKDGAGFLKMVRDYLPFSADHSNRLAVQIRDIIVSTIYGGVVVAILQGIIGGIAYALLGTHAPVLWGLATAIASFIPLLGTFAVWGVISAYFFIQGMAWKGFVLVFVGVFGISMVDNILKPVIIGSKTKMHILVIFFSVLGGINFFGLIGLIMGPLVVAVFVSLVKIFRSIEVGQDV